MTVSRSLGAVMIDIAGLEINRKEREMLLHPSTGGVILFTRNYKSSEQLLALVTSIRELRSPELLIAVDHEGGRVQRFRNGFTELPSMGNLGALSGDLHLARHVAKAVGTIIAYELGSHRLDFSFTPVLDIDYGCSAIIGNRSFSRDPEVIADLAGELIAGLREGGMAAVGKHFPGHGYVGADSHVELPEDNRTFKEIESSDLLPYERMISNGLDAVMPAHVVYPAIDAMPAGFSKIWLQDILRGQLGFKGMIFSDDLSMGAATVAGDILDRAGIAFDAGCDMVIVCNASVDAENLINGMEPRFLDEKLASVMRARHVPDRSMAYGAALDLIEATFR